MDRKAMHGGTVRRLWRTDLDHFQAHLIRLDAESRHDRFSMAVSDDFLVRYAAQCFEVEGMTYGFFAPDGHMRAAGELRLLDDTGKGNGREAEAAFSVEKEWRRRGIGAELMGRIVLAARNRRVDTLYMMCLAHNRAMQSLARKFAALLRFEADEVTGRMVARAPTAFSLWQEMADETGDFAMAALDLQSRTFFPGRAL